MVYKCHLCASVATEIWRTAGGQEYPSCSKCAKRNQSVAARFTITYIVPPNLRKIVFGEEV